ncbi:MAG: RluA family pseudouridine synthase [Candidatus Omnitrophica bacterium]|nr:RluA family pseudouridine synthase [Candidatus Omnitrophota bacterium]MBU1997625.1 RluA family pseudouridine synthase [Candidatus Omnitrophota bacterium]MBU4333257.1 RluA family pseudouridine synthase [Candidatus Omnitrophota bacterium]
MSSQYIKVDQENNHTRLDVFLTAILEDIPSRNYIKKLIESGNVKVNENLVKVNHKVATGDDVCVDIPKGFLLERHIAPEDIPLEIFYEDQNLFVISKPCGMVVHPARGNYSGTLVNALLHHSVELSSVNTDIRPGIVHRLDKETSGLILVAKDNITHTKLAKQFQRHTIEKQYVALVEKEIEFDEGIVDVSLGRSLRNFDKRSVRYDDKSREAVTRYKVIKRHKGVTLVNLFPKTGRTHQLRVHMKFLGHPILGDDKYGNKNSFPRLALHAQSIGFKHPRTKEFVKFSSMPPNEFLKKVGL